MMNYLNSDKVRVNYQSICLVNLLDKALDDRGMLEFVRLLMSDFKEFGGLNSGSQEQDLLDCFLNIYVLIIQMNENVFNCVVI